MNKHNEHLDVNTFEKYKGGIPYTAGLHAFFHNRHFYKQSQAKTGKKPSKGLTCSDWTLANWKLFVFSIPLIILK